MSESTTFKFNVIWRLFSYVSGVIFAVFGIVGGVAIYINSNPIPLCSGLFMFIIISLWLVQSFSLIVTPAMTSLTVDEDGYIYKGLTVIVKSRWVENIFRKEEIPLIGKNNFLIPLHCEVKYSKLENLFLRSTKHTESYEKPIPILYFGSITSKQVQRKIRTHAPYLFGLLLTEAEFLITLDALDKLMSYYANKEILPQLFFMQYNLFYTRYIIHGNDTVKDFFNLITKYSERIAYHTAIWNEIIKPEFPDYEELRQQNASQLTEIRERYEK